MRCSLFALTLFMVHPNIAQATPVIGATTPSVNAFAIGSAKQIDVTSVISDPSVISGSVVLQKINSDGTFADVGLLHDDGLNGDVSFGDRVYTLRFTVSSQVPTELRYRVSAAFKGTLKRIVSEPFSINAQGTGTAEQMLSQLANEMANGDFNAAAKHFSSNPKSCEKLDRFTPDMIVAVSNAFRTATLLRTQGPTRIYSVRIARPDGASVNSEIGLTQIASGEWFVMYW